MQRASLWYKHLLSLALLLTIAAPGCSWHRPAEEAAPAGCILRHWEYAPVGAEDQFSSQRPAIEQCTAAQTTAEAAQAELGTSTAGADE